MRSVRRSSETHLSPAHAGLFLSARLTGRRAMQKGPVTDDGARFGRSSVGGECSLTPPPSQFVTLAFGSRAPPSGLSPFLRFELPDEYSEMRGDGSGESVVLILEALPNC
jgi:hypothetical protein